MGKRIWILNHYAAKDYRDKGWRHYYIPKYLNKEGYEVTVFCANSIHNSEGELCFPKMNHWEEHLAEEIDVPFVFVKARSYEGNSIARILNMLDYYFNVQKSAKQYAKIHGKPDVIIGSSVHPLACVAAIKLAKIFKCKKIIEIRDLWPESIVAYDVASKKNPIIILLYQLEKWIYAKADSIIFTMEGGKDYIVEKSWDTAHHGPVDLNKVHHINNGVDLEMFDYNRDCEGFNDPDLDNINLRKVIYTGAIRKANRSMMALPNIAKELLKKGRKDIQILVYGKGDYEKQLQDQCIKQSITNIKFKGFVNKSKIPYILSKSDVNILNCDKSEMSKYGSSQNKLFEYLASGKPILSGESDKYSIIRNRNCGISKQFSNPKEMAEAIIEMVDHPEKYPDIRSVAEEYDFSRLTCKLVSIIEGK